MGTILEWDTWGRRRRSGLSYNDITVFDTMPKWINNAIELTFPFFFSNL
jgi:hypothetical protein